ncbi:YolD-like family protein [Eubacterium callanderi]|nr:YolD-like family protein [Eubacterium callanderi]
MANADRAKQFSPFAALKGYEEALQLKQKRYTPRIELTEDAKSLLDRKLHILNQWLENGQKPIVTIRYFVPKTVAKIDIELGAYLEISGAVEKINSEARRIQISGESLCIDDVVDLQEGSFNGDF